ncbi:RagB/SusD family nutrient uptake outer membrane protein [Epilithonimonas vandammei]|uniref:RagB/SusD family nutrient uptake outer membrane protein n=1 Tax=Epilithonimonas vandammei TaxID=2487072 RepID=A0A3G8ZGC3_9FLAO|nr:RagB/SusD family nutrient uptake outer membrane protein [Epilithonimonas vandammei]AZI55885.1 RagB/SusD family nutrient uptake outer membrane protein [Epilithonimonas vandammei]
MKKTKYFIISSLALFLFSSCSDSFLEEDYTEAGYIIIDDNAIKTKQDLAKSIRGLYSTLASTSGFGGDYLNYQELTADLAFVSQRNSGYFVGTNGGTHITVDGGAGGPIWNTFYNTIANANFILSYQGKIEDVSDPDLPALDILFTHAKVIRAFNYLSLLTLFSPNYGEGDQSLGVPYTTTYDINAKLPRESVDKVINNVIADLENSLTIGISYLGNNNSFNTDAVKLLLARAYLYKKDYAKAQQYSEEVLAGGDLLSRTGVATFFSTENSETSSEVLFQLEYSKLDPSTQDFGQYWGTGGESTGYKQNFMARNFWSKFTGDARSSSWYGNTAAVQAYPDQVKPIDVRKFINAYRDVILLRRTEAIFIKAECQYHANPVTAFATLRSWIRTYRAPAYNQNLTGTAVLDEILNQKGFEFFMEGLRFSDLKRNNKAIVKYQTAENGQPLTTIPVGDRRFIWPIPYSEMQLNPNIKQAPGY